jgi:hypothetical protein
MANEQLPVAKTNSSPEALEQEPGNPILDAVKSLRLETINDNLARTVHRFVSKLDSQLSDEFIGPVQDYKGEDLTATKIGSWRDGNLRTANTRRSYRAIDKFISHDDGQPPLLTRLKRMEKNRQEAIDLGDGLTMHVEAFGSGSIAKRFEIKPSSNGLDRFVGIMDDINENDPLTRISREMAAKLDPTSQELVSDTELTFAENGDELVSVIGLSGFWLGGFASGQESDALNSAQAVEALYKKLPSIYEGEDPGFDKRGIYYDESGRVKKVVLGQEAAGFYVELHSADPESAADLAELPLKIGFSTDVAEAYMVERSYNGVVNESVRPLAETAFTGEFTRILDQAGLMPSQRILDSLAEVGSIEKRYGHGYAELTRELAKLVNDSSRSLSSFFDGQESELLNRVSALGDTAHPAAQAVVSILRDVAQNRLGQSNTSGHPEIVLSKERVEIRDGSCKDIEIYIDVSNRETEDGLMRWSSYKRPTLVTKQPVMINGVTLPTGSLLLKNDDGYLFMRITSYAFDEPVAREVFGAQYVENDQHGNGRMNAASL